MKITTYLFCSIYLLVSSLLLAQKQNNYWYFGQKAGLNFNSGSPAAPLTNSALLAAEGTATVSDPVTGNLLFYTNGVVVYTKNHTLMPNGNNLYGDSSTLQSACIVPKPGNSNIYYIFTMDAITHFPLQRGLNYSVVDLTLNGGLGDVSAKNVPLEAPMGEALTCTRHGNGTDCWVIAHSYTGNEYHAYLITAAGVNASPVISTTGPTICCESDQLRFSPSGKKLAYITIYDYGFPNMYPGADMCDFDNCTGVVTYNYTLFPQTTFNLGYFTPDFSPDESKFYFQDAQFDLSAGSGVAVQASKVVIAPAPSHFKLGPDGKIYHFTNGHGLITKPNLAGAACNYVPSGFTTLGRASGTSLLSDVPLSVPPTDPSFYLNTTVNNFDCKGNGTSFATINVIGGSGNYSYSWSAVGTNNSTATNLASGTYTVTVTDLGGPGCSVPGSRTISFSIMNDPLSINMLNSTPTTCALNNGSATVAISSGASGSPFTYSWSNGINSISSSSQDKMINMPYGSYTVLATDANGCTSSTSFLVDTFPRPTMNVAVSQPLSCGGTGSVSIVFNNHGTGSSWFVNWLDGYVDPNYYNATGTATRTNMANGTYTVNVTDNGCAPLTAKIIISSPSPLALNPTSVQPGCGNANGGASVNPTGGSGTYSYSWSTGASSQTISALSPGIYSVTVSDGTTCTASTSIILNTNPSPTVNFVGVKNSSCFNGSDGSASISASGGTGILTYNWSNGNTGITALNLPAGNYSVSVTDANGCNAISTISITAPNQINVTIPSVSHTSCGNANGMAAGFASGGSGALSYTWSNGSTGATVTNLAAGTYTLTVLDANSCSNTQSISINTSSIPIISSINAGPILCKGNFTNISVTATGGSGNMTYSWSNGMSSQTTTSIAVGNYTVSVTDAFTCQTTKSIAITEPSGIQILSLTSVNPACGKTNGSISVSAGGGTGTLNYIWSDLSASTGSVLSNIAAGTYTVTVTDANNCNITQSTVISTVSGPSISSATASGILCQGNNTGQVSATVSGGSGLYTYSWSNGSVSITSANASQISNLIAQNYTVTISDAAGCSVLSVINLTQPSVITSSFQTIPVSCFGTSSGSAVVSAIGGTGGFTYAWSNAATGQTASFLSASSYTVTITDANACSSTTNLTLTNPPPLTAPLFTTNNASCGQSNGSIIAFSSGGTGNLSYSWSNGQTGQTNNSLAAGSYTVTITDLNGCIQTASAGVSNTGGPVINKTTQKNLVCMGDNSGTATVFASGGTGTLSYSWSTGTKTKTINFASAATYTITVSDANSCVAISTVVITEPATYVTIDSITAVSASCSQGNGSAVVNASGGTGSLTYNWSNGTVGKTASNLSGIPYSVIVTDNNGCSVYSTTVINQSGGGASLSSSVTNSVKCFSGTGSIKVFATAGLAPFTFNWSNGASTTTGTGTDQQINLAAATYTITLTDNIGCSSTTIETLTQPPLLIVTATSANAKCGIDNGSISLVTSGGSIPYFYTWSNGPSGVSAITGLSAGNYSATISDANGCTATTSSALTSTGSPGSLSVSASEQIITQGNSVSLMAGGAASYTWSPASGLSCATCSNTTANPLTTTVYTVNATDINGCTLSNQVTITVLPGCTGSEKDIFVANIFSPNGDGLNDILKIEGDGLKDIYWAIYDRWGNLLFESSTQSQGWDGTKHGNALEAGTYVYYLKATCLTTNSEVRLKGNVSLVK